MPPSAPHILRDQFSSFEAKLNRAKRLPLRAERRAALCEAREYLAKIKGLPRKQRAAAEQQVEALLGACLEPPKPEAGVTVGQVRQMLAAYSDETLVTALGDNAQDPEWMRQVVRLLALRPRPISQGRPLQWSKPPGEGNLGPGSKSKLAPLALATSQSLEDVFGL